MATLCEPYRRLLMPGSSGPAYVAEITAETGVFRGFLAPSGGEAITKPVGGLSKLVYPSRQRPRYICRCDMTMF